MPAILIEQITRDYSVGFSCPQFCRTLSRLTLSVEAGEVFGHLGLNGAGKTTTLKLLLQLARPMSGHAEILDQAGVPCRPLATGRVVLDPISLLNHPLPNEGLRRP
jgi:ABC-type multidrug transport system ATPase subunit